MDTDSIINTEEGRLLPRLEKKARQTLAKLGLKRVEGINRVVLRRPGGVSRASSCCFPACSIAERSSVSPLVSPGPLHRWKTRSLQSSRIRLLHCLW